MSTKYNCHFDLDGHGNCGEEASLRTDGRWWCDHCWEHYRIAVPVALPEPEDPPAWRVEGDGSVEGTFIFDNRGHMVGGVKRVRKLTDNWVEVTLLRPLVPGGVLDQIGEIGIPKPETVLEAPERPNATFGYPGHIVPPWA